MTDKIPPQPIEPLYYEDEIDLRYYIDVLINWWREILLLTLVPLVLTLLLLVGQKYLSTTDSSYKSSAIVALASIKSEINFEERFRTVSDGQVATNGNSRRTSLIALVKNGGIAEAVIEELTDSLNEKELTPISLLQALNAEFLTLEDSKAESDLIRITATADSPQKAVAIANAWAKHYVEQVNKLYAQAPDEVLESVEAQLVNAQVSYETSQKNLEAFVASNQADKLTRKIEDKKGIITKLQESKNLAIAAIMEEEINVRRQLISAYINALSSNRLLAFSKEQAAKQELIGAYIDSEVQSRLLAITKDREAREMFFNQVANAQIESTTAVFNQQIQEKISGLEQAYVERSHLQNLLQSAQVLKNQIEEGGDGATQTNTLALVLLKSQIFTSPIISTGSPFVDNSTDNSSDNPYPLNLQLNLDVTTNNNADAADQLTDITALIDALQARITELDADIEKRSQQLVSGNDYQLLDQFVVSELGTSAPITQTLAALSQEENEDAENGTSLSQAVVGRYMDLFGVGGLAEVNEEVTADSALLTRIEALYPELFTLDALAGLTENLQQDSPLALVTVDKAQELLQLRGLEEILSHTATAEPLAPTINQLESEIQSLEALLQSESSRELQLTQQRDLTWETYTTLSKKVAELKIAQTVTDSEVRLVAPAIPPIDPVSIENNLARNLALAALVELMLAVFVVFFAQYLGKSPFLSSRTQKVKSAS